MTFTIAIAGRPNVGKSTLYNRLIGRKMALVSDEPGVTRDWREGDAKLFDLSFRVLDTAGLEDNPNQDSIAERMVEQTNRALAQTDVIVMVVDGRVGLTAEDKVIARKMRKTGKPIILVANKCESTRIPDGVDEIGALGFGEPILISAVHGDGMPELSEALRPYIEAASDDDDADIHAGEGEKQLHITIAGRPNAGKSTLINSLIGEERMMTGPEPGLTRDAIPVLWNYNGQPMRLVDTAGLRRRARIEKELEKMSAHESLRAIRLAHVVILVLDANNAFDKQDLTIAHHTLQEGRALVIAINKWDTVKNKREQMKIFREHADSSLSQVSGVPIVTISALKGEGLDRLMQAVISIYEKWNMRVTTGQLNRWLADMEDNHPPPITGGRRIKLRYMTQVKARPPTFALWLNKPIDLPDSYQRFLTNGLREMFGLQGVPLRWLLKKTANPYENKKNEDE
jgi:GTP-binding protein